MSEPSSVRIPILTVTDYPSIGTPWIGVKEPMERSISINVLNDIHSKLDIINIHIRQMQEAQQSFIDHYRSLPWVRLWDWIVRIWNRI